MRHTWMMLLAVGLVASGCDSGSADCGEPLYAGGATDEAWRALVDARRRPAGPSSAVTLLAPAEGQEYPTGAPAPRWEWTSPLSASRPSLPPVAPTRERSRSWAAWLGELLLPSAHAHLPPFTGDIYWLEVSAPGRACPVVQVLTSELYWEVEAEAWAALGQVAGQELTLQVTSAYLLNNQVTEGPFQLATPRPFRRATP